MGVRFRPPNFSATIANRPEHMNLVYFKIVKKKNTFSVKFKFHSLSVDEFFFNGDRMFST